MAILEKRKAVNKLPRFKKYQDTRAGDRAAELRGEPARLRSEAPITSAIRQLAGSSGQMGKSQGFNQMGGAGKATVDKFGNTAGQPKTAVTSALKGTTAAEKAVAGKVTGTGTTAGKTTGTGTTVGKVAGTTSKLPGLTSKTAGTAGKTLTSTGTGKTSTGKTATTTGTTGKTLTSTGTGKTVTGKTATTTGTTGAKTLTSTGSGTTKTTGAKTTGSTGSSLGKTLTSALAGAALGAGTKFVIDKLTGTKKTADTTDKVAGTGKVVAGTGAKTVAGTGLTSKTNTLGTNIGKTLVDQVLPVKKTTLPVKKITAPVTKTTTPVTKTTAPVTKTTNTTGTGTAKTGDLTSVIKAVTGAKTTGSKTPVTKTPATGGGSRSLAGAATGATKGDDAIATGAAYDEDGNLMPGYELDENGNPVFVGDSNSSTTYNPDGSTGVESTGVAYDEDGNLMPGYELNENGDPVFVGDADSTIYDPSGGSITSDTETIDSIANSTETLDDGTIVTYGASGEVVSYTDPDGSIYDPEGNILNEETVAEEEVAEEDAAYSGLYSDEEGNLYDAEGNFVQYADGSFADSVDTSDYSGLYSDEEGNLFDAEGNFVQYADGSSADSVDTSDEYIGPDTTSDVAYTDEYGNTYDITGQMIDEGEYNVVGEDSSFEYDPYNYEDQYAASDEYNANDEYSYDEYGYDDLYGAKGGLLSMKNGGAPVHMIEGGGASVDGDPVREEESADGTITQYFDDGSSIIYNQDGEVVKVAEAKGYADGSLVSKYSDDQIAELIKLEEKISSRKLTDYEREDIESQIAEIENNPLGNEPTIQENFTPAEAAQGSGFGSAFSEEVSPYDFEPLNNSSGAMGAGANKITAEQAQQIYNDPRYNPAYSAQNQQFLLNSDAGSMDNLNDQATQGNTQYFDDGSSITYDKDGNVAGVTNSDGTTSTQVDRLKTITNARPLRALTSANAVPPEVESVGKESFDLTYQPRVVASRSKNPLEGISSPPEGWPPAGFSLNDDGSNTATYVDDDGSTVTIDTDNNIVNVTDANGEVVAQDNEPVTTGGLAQANQDIQYFDDGSYIQTFDDGTSLTFDSDGNPFRSTDTEGNSELATTRTYDDFGNQTISDYYGNIVKVLDPEGNVIPLGGGRVNTTPITSAGGTGAGSKGEDEGDPNAGGDVKSAIDKLLAGLNTYGGAGAAGAVLGSLLSDTDLFGGGGGGSNFDMTGVGEISPRTTDFGIGPANYVGYDEYGTPEQMPELYGNELYQNLNAPGFNEVNPGDYERMDNEEFVGPVGEDNVEEVGMAEGGMPQGGLGQGGLRQTYYTFGTPVDPLQNLRNPKPFQQQPQMPPQAAQNAQQAPQQMPQMGMPPMAQGMPPAMRRGGLPHASNVPMTQGRMDFRRGSAVHGAGDGQSDDIPAMLADGEYVLDSELVAQIGNGSTKAGAEALDRFRENIRAHKRSAPINKIPPKTKVLTSYLKGAR